MEKPTGWLKDLPIKKQTHVRDPKTMPVFGEHALMIADELRSIRESLLSLLFPRLCHFCDSFGALGSTSLCGTCQDALKPPPSPVCAQCGLPLGGLAGDAGMLCGRCLTKPPPYARARYGFLYSGGLREGIVRFKYRGRLYLGPTLGNLLCNAFARYFQVNDYDLIVPVPVHRKRLLDRGFNQAVLLGEHLSDATGIRLDRTGLEKVRDTPPQVGLTRNERLKNLRGCFGVAARSSIPGKRVLVVDDVATTGSTIAEAAKTLLSAGAVQADALVLALRTETVETAPNDTHLGGDATWL